MSHKNLTPFGEIRGDSGFTLIEIIAVLLLLGILTAIAINHSADFLNGNNVIIEADTLKNNLRYIQMRAMNSSDSGIWRLKILGNKSGYAITKNTGASLGSPTWTPQGFPGEDETTKGTHVFTSNVLAATANQTVYFNHWGIPVDSAGTRNNANITIILNQASSSKTVTITKNTGYTSL